MTDVLAATVQSPIPDMIQSTHGYDQSGASAVYQAIFERRDIRHFVAGAIEPEVMERLFSAANAAPSVGLSQPWRFLRISSPQLRRRIYDMVQEERSLTAQALGERSDEFLRLKVEGILECSEVVVAAVQSGGDKEIFGRRLLPEMDLASVACAIQNMWLAARAEGLGMGWVSMFDPRVLGDLLGCPFDVRPIAILCIGQVEKFEPLPMLVRERWRDQRSWKGLVFDNLWPMTNRGEAESIPTTCGVSGLPNHNGIVS